MLEMAIATIRKRLKNINVEDDLVLPYYVKSQCAEKLDQMSIKIKNRVKENLR